MESFTMWKVPIINEFELLSKGDMPQDKIEINENLYNKSKIIFKKLINSKKFLELYNDDEKIVISVFGGSGSGKSTTASILASLFNYNGVVAYVLSGDNYPNRVPIVNDSERLRIYRDAGLKGLVFHNEYNEERHSIIRQMQKNNTDSDESLVNKYSWIKPYIYSGKKALADYLGTDKELDLKEVSDKLIRFKNKETNIFLKRMGGEQSSTWYEKVNFLNVKILILEWTHGGNENLQGVDFSIMLNSTPTETLEYRKIRGRDSGVDSFFTNMVLGIEQQLLINQSKNADIIQ